MADTLVVRGAREHNLRNIDLELPRDQLIVFTGLSGSGKSSLAFDTIYAEGQRRYVESLSAYARQFLGQMDKPDVDFIEGLSPAISIDQKSASRNPRSTVGTITEVYDYLRLLYARIGVPHCPNDGTRHHAPDAAADRRPRPRSCPRAPASRCSRRSCAAARASTTRCSPTSPAQGFARARVDGEVVDLAEPQRDERLARYEQHTIEVVVDRLVRRDGIERRLTDSLETALRLAEGVAEVEIVPEGRREAERRDAHLQPAPRLPAVRHVVRRAGAAQLLVQLALRRVRALRRARHDASRSIPSWSSPTPTCRSTRARSRRGRGAARSTSTGCSRRSPTSYGIDLDTPWTKLHARRSRRSCSTAPASSKVHGQVQEPLRPQRSYTTQLRGRDPVARAPPHRRRERLGARADRGLHARGAVPRVRRRPAQAGVARGHRSAARTSPRSASCRSARRPSSSPALELPSATG